MLNDFNANSDNNKRQLYVAMTRAKQNSSVHYNGSYLNGIEVEKAHLINDTNTYTSPKHLVYHLTHNDINLGYFGFIQHRIHAIQSGQTLSITDKGLVNSNAEMIVKFSKYFLERKTMLEQKGFEIKESKVNFILYWKMKEADKKVEEEIKIVLPELYFER